jgi:cytoskeletal protein CcmA (bactofilin family)
MNDAKSANLAGSGLQKRTLVEEGTHFKGSLTSTCPMLVQGSIEGDVTGPALTVNATGSVAGKVTTGALVSDGKIAGEFEVETAQLAGKVADKTIVRAGTIDVKLTAPSGKLKLTFSAK